MIMGVKIRRKKRKYPLLVNKYICYFQNLFYCSYFIKIFSSQKIDTISKTFAPKPFSKSCIVDQSSYYNPTKFKVKQARIIGYLEGKANVLPVHCSW